MEKDIDLLTTEEMLNDMEENYEEIRKRKAAYYLTNLYDFNKHVMGWPDISEVPHRELCDFVDDKSKQKKLILLPRGHLKSSMVTVGYCVQQIARNPAIRILIINATYTMACTFLSQIKKTLQYNKVFRELYGSFDQNASMWSKDGIMVSQVEGESEYLTKEPTVVSWGVGGSLVSQHYDLVVMDDLVARENIGTKDQMEKVITCYRDVLDLLETGVGKHPYELIVIGTRWDDYDLYGWILDKKNKVYKNFSTLIKSAYEGDLETGDDLKVLFPKKFNRRHLLELKGEKGIYEFSCQYMNDPVPSESATFRKDWFRYYETSDIKGESLNIFTLIDPAVSVSSSADYSAIVTIGLDKAHNIYIMDIVRKHLKPMDLIDEMFMNYERWHPHKMGIEAVSFSKTIKPFTEAEMRRRNVYMPLEEVKPLRNEGKELRIGSLEPYYRRGQIYHNRDLPQNENLEDELMRFPKGRHDDVIDALAYFPTLAFPPRQRTSSMRRRNRYLY